ncbi:MAG: flagellar biosynthesis repressor FlbT [Pseudomonadota bacterium]
MHISLRAGERIFLNGAVLRVDRKVTLELMNDATFLLENHVMQVEETTTPLRRLYFAAQAMLMDPANAAGSRALFDSLAGDIQMAIPSGRLGGGVEDAVQHVGAGRPFHALRCLRNLFDEEAQLLAGSRGRNACETEPNASTRNTADAAMPRAGSVHSPHPSTHLAALGVSERPSAANTNGAPGHGNGAPVNAKGAAGDGATGDALAEATPPQTTLNGGRAPLERSPADGGQPH